MTNISTAGILLRNTQLVQVNNQNFQDLQFQLSTGRRFSELRRYEEDAFRLVEFRSEVQARENYIANIERTQSTIGAYNESLEHISNLIDQTLDLAFTGIDNAELPPFISSTADNLLADLEATLNAEFGGRFIFGGLGFDAEPVANLTTLPTPEPRDADLDTLLGFSTATTLQVAGAFSATNGITQAQLEAVPIVPYFRTGLSVITEAGGISIFNSSNRFSYLNSFSSETQTVSTANVINSTTGQPLLDQANNSDSFIESLTTRTLADFNIFSTNQRELTSATQIRLSDQRTNDYGISASDVGFAQLVFSLQNLKASAQTGVTEDQRNIFIDRARSAAETSRERIRNLQVEVSLTNDRLESYREHHQNFNVLSSDTVTRIQQADTSQAAIEISNLRTLLQASFSAIGQQQRLSLVNFLN